jgi:Fur family transcriptional regulator, ferric uptake regulator
MERDTRQRRAVLDALAGSGRTLSPPEILSMAQAQAPSLNLSTVYRQVKALEEVGQVVKVQLPGQAARFEARCRHQAPGLRQRQGGHEAHAADDLDNARGEHHHHHFHCTVCDQVVPIHGCPGRMQELAPPGFQVERHDLVLHGRCAACAASAAR